MSSQRARAARRRRDPAAARRPPPFALAVTALPIVSLLALPSAVGAHELGVTPTATDLGSILQQWSFEPGPSVGILLSTALYLWLVRRVDRAHPAHPWPRRRLALFLLGMASLVLAVLSPIDALSDDLGTVHMVQHMLLLMAVPPLLAGSAPATLLLRASTRRVRERWVLPALHSRVLAILTFPVVGWIAFAGVLWATHYGPIYDLALRDPTVHIGEHLAYLVAASLFWWPVFSPDPLRWRMPAPARLLYVLLQMPQMSFLSVTILGAPRLLYEAYQGRTAAFGLDAMADQANSAAIMWIVGDMMFVLAMLFVVGQWMREQEVEERRVDARLDRLDRLDHQRRLAAAGPPGAAGLQPPED